MWKWIGRIAYFFIIAFLSLQVYGYAYFQQLNAYYKDHVEPNLDNPILILEGMNTLLGLSYFQETPFYETSFDDGSTSFNLGIYAVGAVSDSNPVEGYAMVMYDFNVTHEGTLLERPLMKLTVEMTHPTFLVNNLYETRKSITFDPGSAFSFQNVPLFFMFDFDGYNQIQDSEEVALISRIELSYGYIENDTYVFSDQLLFLASKEPTNQRALKKDESFMMTLEDYQFSLALEEGIPSSEHIESLNLNITRGDISGYQSIMTRFIILFLAFVFVLTYFLFFHKSFVKYLKRNKTQKPNIPVNAIFKDNE